MQLYKTSTYLAILTQSLKKLHSDWIWLKFVCTSGVLQFRSGPAGGGKAASTLKYTQSSRTRHASVFSARTSSNCEGED